MNAAVLLCLTVLAADSSTAVRAKVLYGTSPDQQHRADIDLWISQVVAKAGSPLAQPYTGWINLTSEEQRLYTSRQGGFILGGKASERNGKYEVEINGCDGFPIQKTVTLKPGERRVVKLTDNPAPNNVFIALEAPLSAMAMKRAKQLKASVKTFRLQLDYSGEQGKPFYRLILSVPLVPDRSNPFSRSVQITEAEAERIIDRLTTDGFLDRADDLKVKVQRPPCKMPGYTLTVTAEEVALRENLGWGLPMLQRLDGLRKVLEGNAAKEMDLLLGRLSGLRAQWERNGTARSTGTKTSFKGWELYVWDDGGETNFALLVGTNRLKSDEEITQAAVKGLDAIKPKLNELKAGQYVSVHGRRLNKCAPEDQAKAVAEYCTKIGLKVQ